MSSVSPRKRQKQMVPEVVIIMDHRHSVSPRSPSKTRAARNAQFNRIQKQNGIEEEDEEDEAFRALSKLEQIKLRAKRRAQADEKSKMNLEDPNASRGGRRGLQKMKEEEEDSDDSGDDDDLPDLDTHFLRKNISSTPLSSAPTTTRSGSVINSSMTSTNGKPSSSYELSRRNHSSIDLPSISQDSNTSALGSQRSRRITAKTDSYVFLPSLEPLSERRQKLELAKQSAAVQAKVIEKGSFRASVTDGRNDTMDKTLRDHRRDQKKGYNYESLTRTVEMVNKMQKEDEDIISSSQIKLPSGETSVLQMNDDEDTSSASSEESDIADVISGKGPRKVKFDQALSAKERQDEKQRYTDLMGGEGNESTNELMEILFETDKPSQDKDVEAGEEDMDNWSTWHKGRPNFILEPLKLSTGNGACAKMLMEATQSGEVEVLCTLLGSSVMMALISDLSKNHPGGSDLHSLIVWLLETAILKKTSNVSFAALDLICEALAKKMESVSKLVISHLPRVLIKMGIRSDLFEHSFGLVNAEFKENQTDQRQPKMTLRRGERLRATDRILQIADAYMKSAKDSRSVKGSKTNQIEMSYLDIFMLLLMLSLDKSMGSAKIRMQKSMETIFQQHGMELMLLCLEERLHHIVTERVASVTPIAVFDILPASTMKSRLFRQRLVYHIFDPCPLGLVGRDTSFKEVAEILKSRDASINLLLVTKDRSHSQVLANVHLLGYLLSDVALNIVSFYRASKEVKAGPILSRTVKAYQHALSESDNEDGDEEGEITIQKEQIKGLFKIIEDLRILGGKIQDGKGAFLNRSRVKDQIQRLRLMVQYTLYQYGIVDEKATKQKKQASISTFMKTKKT